MRSIWIALSLAALSATAQELPSGPGRTEADKLCRQCHEMARSISKRQDREAWNATMTRMTAFGMKSNDQDYALVLDYLTKNYPAEDIPRVNVNTARAIELESGLSLRRSQAASVLDYRSKNGPFKSIEDLKKVPLVDPTQIEAKKDRITF